MTKLADIGAGQTADLLDGVTHAPVKKALARLQKTLSDPRTKEKQRQWEAERGQVAKTQQSAQIIQLPPWPEQKRGVPNIALRGALFSVIQGKKRGFIKKQILAVQDGYKISFTGEQLNQLDLDVWETVLHIADQQQINLGTECYISVYALLKAMGKSPKSGDNQKLLNDTLTRLSACEVELREGDYVYGGSLVVEHYRDDFTGRYVIILNPKLIKLYWAGYTQIEFNDIKKLGQKNLAKWLYRYYVSHEKPYPLTVDKIRELCGSSNPHKGSFTRDLKTALQRLVDIGFLLSFKLDSGKVYVQRA